jgi:hypothetical protein
LTSFYEKVPKEILPNEYGGEAGSVAEHWGMTDDDFICRSKNPEHIMLIGTSFLNNRNKVK